MKRKKTEYIATRIGSATKEKIMALAEIYGTQTAAFTVAIDRLYQQHFGDKTETQEACVESESVHAP